MKNVSISFIILNDLGQWCSNNELMMTLFNLIQVEQEGAGEGCHSILDRARDSPPVGRFKKACAGGTCFLKSIIK